MAEKPKTYPQQIQELKQQLADKDERLSAQMESLALIPELQAEIAELRDQVDNSNNADVQKVRADKATRNDLVQRAEQAEQSNRNLQDKIKMLEYDLAAVETQLSSAKKQATAVLEYEAKVHYLLEQLKAKDADYRALVQQVNDRMREATNGTEQLSRELKTLRLQKDGIEKSLVSVQDKYQEDTSKLKAQNELLTEEVSRLRTVANKQHNIIAAFKQRLDDVPDIKASLNSLLSLAPRAESEK